MKAFYELLDAKHARKVDLSTKLLAVHVASATLEKPKRPTLLQLLRKTQAELRGDTSGNVAIEFGLILSILGPVCIYGGRTIGPRLLDWANTLQANVAAAQALLSCVGGH